MNDRDAVADETHHREIMTDEQIGQPAPTLQLGHQVQHLSTDGYVQSRDGLVRNNEFRFHDKRAGDADALALPAGELVRKTAGKFR